MKRAWSDAPGHIITKDRNGTHGYDISCALALVNDICSALLDAQNPKPKAPELPEGWRWVATDEDIIIGDVNHRNGWTQVANTCGNKPTAPHTWRRRIQPDPGEGWRWVEKERERHEYGDVFNETGLVIPEIMVGQTCLVHDAFRRRIQPDPGEGWRLLKPHCEIVREGDELSFDYGKTWIAAEKENIGCEFNSANGLFFRRRIAPLIERCPEGYKAYIDHSELGYRVKVCEAGWQGTPRSTPEGAIAAWNTVMRSHRIAKQLAEALKIVISPSITCYADFRSQCDQAEEALQEWEGK